MKLPASQFYWADWLRDPAVRASSLEARGLWMDMLAHMHAGTPRGFLRINDRPVTDEQLARMVGEPLARIRKLLHELEQNGVFARAEDGAIYSKRMMRDERVRALRAEAGKLGGNPHLLVKQKVNQEVNQGAKQILTPSVAVAVASSEALLTTTATTPLSPAKVRGGWPARISALWCQEVGVITPARVGTQLRPLVALYPDTAAATTALEAAVHNFAKHRRLALERGEAKPDNWPQFVRDLRDYLPPAHRPPTTLTTTDAPGLSEASDAA